MATLTETSYVTKNIIKYGSIIAVALFVLKMSAQFAINTWRQLHPPPSPSPTVSFGKINGISFPEQEKIGGIQYKLETANGILPQFEDRAKVYFMPYQLPNLMALEQAKEKASYMGFKNEPEVITEKKYQWSLERLSGLVLTMNIYDGSFTLAYDWPLDSTILLEKNLPGREQAKAEALNFMQKIDLLEKDLSSGRIEVNYLKVSGRNLISAPSPSEAQFCQVNMFRQNIDDLPVLTYHPQKGIVSMIISGSKNIDKKFVKVEYNYFPVKYDSFATYPIITSSQAWQKLQQGDAFIANWKGSGNQVTIRKVYLAYFDSLEPQKYLQPIVVFEGDDGFLAYVEAITPQWTQ